MKNRKDSLVAFHATKKTNKRNALEMIPIVKDPA